jgi:secondary thiamine-phosphate synthase enzyme
VIHQSILEVATRGRGTTDITGRVAEAVAASGVRTGTVALFLQHTSAALMVCENADPDVRVDLETALAGLAPDGDPRFRHTAEGPDDMAAHVRSVLVGVSLLLPVVAGRPGLGTWQGLYLWEHRQAGSRRRVVVTVQGE